MFLIVNVSDGDETTASFDIDNTVLLIYTYVVFTVVIQLINIFGITTNIINIICFIKQGFNDSINISLLGLSVADLCSLVFMACLCLFLTPVFNTANLPFDCDEIAYLVLAMQHFSFTRVSSCITALITIEKCLSIVAPLKVKSILIPSRTALVVACIFVLFTCSGTPIYSVNRLAWKYSLMKNRTLVGLVYTEDKDAVEKVTFLINNFVVPFGAFAIVAFCTVILSSQLRTTSEWRRKTISDSQADRISRRNLRVAKMVVTISTLFIICFVPSTIVMLAVAFEPALSVQGKHMKISIIIVGFSYLMEGINSSMNVFIYHHMSSKYRDTFQKLFNIKQVKLKIDIKS